MEYSWPQNRTRTLADSGRALLKPKRYYQISRATLYENDEVEITDNDIEAAIEKGKDRLGEEFKSLLLGAEPPAARSRLQNLFTRASEYWYWNDDILRYVDDAGKLFSRSQMNKMLAKSIDLSAAYVTNISEQLVETQITRSQFISMLKEELKNEYIRQYMLGRGGYEQMTKKDWGSVGGALAEQYRFIDSFADELLKGELSPAQVANRSNMYSNSARETFERARAITGKAWGADEEKWNIVGPNTCDDCLANAALGYQEIGFFSVPGDGSTACITNCHCYKTFRNSTTGEEYEG